MRHVWEVIRRLWTPWCRAGKTELELTTKGDQVRLSVEPVELQLEPEEALWLSRNLAQCAAVAQARRNRRKPLVAHRSPSPWLN